MEILDGQLPTILNYKNKKFPWWILLLLLPLLLLIPIKRSVHVQVLDNFGQPAAQQNCQRRKRMSGSAFWRQVQGLSQR